MSIFSALQDVRVLDLTGNLAGPFSTQILGDLGADVIKVERPGKGDDTRSFAPLAGDESVVFASVNRNKRSMLVDLKSEEGRELALRLGATCDVVVESFRPGAADRLGLGYEAFRAADPAVVYCSVSAFGRSEAGKDLPGYDPLIQAFSGIMATTGHPGNPPTRVSASLIDLTTGMWAALGIVAALADRHRSGTGQHVEATLIDSGYALMCHQLAGYLATGDVPQQLGSASPITAPYEAFETKDAWVMIAAGNDDLFRRLCGAVDAAGLIDDPRFESAKQRTLNREALHRELERKLLTADRETWIRKIRGAGVPIGPVNEIDEAAAAPIADERGLVIRPGGEAAGGAQVVRLPLMSNGQPMPPANPSPDLGADTTSVLAELADIALGRDSEQAVDPRVPGPENR